MAETHSRRSFLRTARGIGALFGGGAVLVAISPEDPVADLTRQAEFSLAKGSPYLLEGHTLRYHGMFSNEGDAKHRPRFSFDNEDPFDSGDSRTVCLLGDRYLIGECNDNAVSLNREKPGK